MSNLPKYFYFRVKATRKGTAIEVEDASDCDVVEVVRCKDCRYNTSSHKCLNPDSFFLIPADDFYCGYAERRSDETD